MDSGHIGDRIGSDYADHLTEADLRVLASASDAPVTPEQLRRTPEAVPALFDRPAVYEAVLGAGAREPGLMVGVSPFLVFAVAIHRLASDLSRRSRQEHQVDAARADAAQHEGASDIEQLRDFLGSLARRLFLAELLTSFTPGPSERYQVRGGDLAESERRTGLDPASLARVLDEVPATEQPGIYRRLGDLALFLAGVFPDRAGRHVFGEVQPEHVLPLILQAGPAQATSDSPVIALLERLGSRYYRAAYELTPVRSARLAVVAEVADRFSVARRALDQVAHRHLFPAGLPWFGPQHP